MIPRYCMFLSVILFSNSQWIHAAYHTNLTDTECMGDTVILKGIPPDMVLHQGDAIPAWPEISVGELASTITIVPTSTYSYHSWGEKFERRWTAFGPEGPLQTAQQMIVVLTSMEFFKIPADTIIQCGEGIPAPDYTMTGPDGDFKVAVGEKFTDDKTGCYTVVRTYKLLFAGQEVTRDSQWIQVVDNEAPQIKMIHPLFSLYPNGGEVPMFGEGLPDLSLADVEISDNCSDPKVDIQYDKIENGALTAIRPYERWKIQFIAEDPSGNKSEFTLYINQYDPDG